MPFFDDSGPKPEEATNPIARSFALVKDQLERLIVINLLWTLQCVPLILAWALTMPGWLRILLTAYTRGGASSSHRLLFALTEQVSLGVP